MLWQDPISGVTHDIVELCLLAVCRLHELMRKHVWKIRMLFILSILSQSVISHICFTKCRFDMTPRHLHPACQDMGYILTYEAPQIISSDLELSNRPKNSKGHKDL